MLDAFFQVAFHHNLCSFAYDHANCPSGLQVSQFKFLLRVCLMSLFFLLVADVFVEVSSTDLDLNFLFQLLIVIYIMTMVFVEVIVFALVPLLWWTAHGQWSVQVIFILNLHCPSKLEINRWSEKCNEQITDQDDLALNSSWV